MDQKRTTEAFATDREALGELGQRLARTRLERNWTQKHLAGLAGVSQTTVKRLEGGSSTQLTNLVRILRALGLVENLEALVPRPELRPLEALASEQRRRRRASSRSGTVATDDEGRSWTWGDEREGDEA